MSKGYFELRKQSKVGSVNLAADMMRHLHARQYLGKAVVVCERPSIFLSAAHKQWLKLSRTIQRQRTSTSNADKILKYTHTITHMQHLRFVAHTPLEAPDADVYFIRREQLDNLPFRCATIYLTTALSAGMARTVLLQLPPEALLVDYDQTTPWAKLDVAPKRALEERVVKEWQRGQDFLGKYGIDTAALYAGPIQAVDVMDNALDTLLGVSHQFLKVADSFNHALELARPLRVSKALRREYDIFTLLAHRVMALSSPSFTQRFLETYNEDDAFFLYDSQKNGAFIATILGGENLGDAVARHHAAGRQHLAAALRVAAQSADIRRQQPSSITV